MKEWLNRMHFGDCIKSLDKMPSSFVHTCVTSPPYYGLRDYHGHHEQLGQEKTPEQFIANLVRVFRAVRRVLRDDGTLWVVIGDNYFGGSDNRTASSSLKPKDLIGVPWMLAFALRADGWYLRSDIIWSKPNPMVESIQDRPTKSHEYIFLLSKSERYFYDIDAIKEPSNNAGRLQKLTGKKGPRRLANGRIPGGNERADAAPVIVGEMKNKRSVWTVNARAYSGAHSATYPEALIEPCVLAGSPVRGIVLDPFMGSGTTAAVAARLERYWIGCELNEQNHALQMERLGRTWLYEPRTRVRLDEGRVRL